MKAKSLSEIIYNFNKQAPLTPEEKEDWESFYIDTKRDDINHIKEGFLESSSGYKVLFGGHSGNGKSTELNKFVHDPDIRDRFSIIKFDIKEQLNPHDIEIVELFLMISFQLVEFSEGHHIPIDKKIDEQLKKIAGFFHDELKIESSQIKANQKEMNIKAQAGTGFTLPFLKLKSDFSTKMQGQRESRELVRTEFRPRLNELIELLNRLLAGIKSKARPANMLIIIDGLDRVPLKVAEKLFVEDGQNIALVTNASMLLTIPISIIHSVKSAPVESVIGPIRPLRNIRLLNRKGKRDKQTTKNWELMRQLVLHRLEPELISEKALELAVKYSGGMFRTLIELIAFAAIESKIKEGKAIDEHYMKKAVTEFKIKKSRPLSKDHWAVLLEIHQEKDFMPNLDDKRLELLAGLYALEYSNGEEWYAINPLLEDKLERYKQLVNSEKEE